MRFVDTSFFEEVRSRARRSLEAAPAEAREVLAEPAGQRAAPASHVVIFFDDSATEAANRAQLVDQLRDFVDGGQVPAEQVLLLTFGESLEVQANFGSSRRDLQLALDRVALGAARGTLEAGSKRLAIQQLQQEWTDAQQLGSRGERLA